MVNHDWFTHHLNKVHGTPNHTGPYPCKTSRETPCYIGMSQYLRNSRGPWLSCLPLSRSERPSSLAMIKSSISSYQDQLATFVGIVCQDKKARPQKHSEGYEPKTTFFLTSIRNGTNSQIFITAST